MRIRIKSKAALAAMAFGTLGLSAAAVHVGCKEGAGFSEVRRGLVNTVGQVTGQTKVTDTVNAGADAKQALDLDADDENTMGQNVALSITNSYPLTRDEQLNKYVSLVGLSLVEVSPRPVGNWQFGVLESEEVNAFAGPNGYIFVTTGALDQMDDESELAGVLAHEITHVLHHHGLAGIKQNAGADFFKEVLRIQLADKDRFGLTSKLAEPVVDVVGKKGYARAQELDADRTGIDLVVAAGYVPNGLVRFLQRLEDAGGDLMSTHPGKAERVSSARAQIAKLGNPKGKTLKARFQKNVNQ